MSHIYSQSYYFEKFQLNCSFSLLKAISFSFYYYFVSTVNKSLKKNNFVFLKIGLPFKIAAEQSIENEEKKTAKCDDSTAFKKDFPSHNQK